MDIEREQKLFSALKEVMEWINNWDSPFLFDAEWPETEDRVKAALDASEAFFEQAKPQEGRQSAAEDN